MSNRSYDYKQFDRREGYGFHFGLYTERARQMLMKLAIGSVRIYMDWIVRDDKNEVCYKAPIDDEDLDCLIKNAEKYADSEEELWMLSFLKKQTTEDKFGLMGKPLDAVKYEAVKALRAEMDRRCEEASQQISDIHFQLHKDLVEMQEKINELQNE